MNTLTFTTRRRLLSITTLLQHHPTTTFRSFKTTPTNNSYPQNTLRRPQQRKLKWVPPPIIQNPTTTTTTVNPKDFTTLSNLLKNPALSPGPALEDALNRTGIEPDESLLEQIFSHFDSSPKALSIVFSWAEKQPGFKFSLSVFNAMINVLGKARDFDSAWCLILDRVENIETRPSLDTFAILIRRYARAGMYLRAIRAYESASNLDFIRESDTEHNLFAILLDSLSKEGLVREASEYFDKQRRQDRTFVPSTRMYNILLNGWFRSRKLKKAERLWMEMKRDNVKPTVVTYGTLVEGLCRMRRPEMANDLIGEMKSQGIEPNAIVYNPIIDALGEAGRLDEALRLMERFLVMESGPTISTYNSLVKGFCKAGDLEGASKILKTMISRDIIPTPTTYNYFFKYFSRFGKVEEGLNLYTKMIESGYIPDRLTYHLMVKMLCEDGNLNLAIRISKQMREKGYDLDLATCTMLIHLLCKKRQFDEAVNEFENMFRKGIVPQYLTYQKLSDELQKEGMMEKVRKLDALMASVPHSTKLPDTYIDDRDTSQAMKKSVLQKAAVMSDVLKTCNNPRELVKRRNSRGNILSSAIRLMDDIKEKSNWPSSSDPRH